MAMLALTVALYFQVAAAAPLPQLQVVDPLQFRADGGTASFLVFSTDRLTDLAVVVRDSKDPQGNTGPALTCALESHDVTPSGTRVTIALDPQAFVLAGDYHATLVIAAKSGASPVQIVKLATFTRVKPDIAAPGLLNNVIQLQRPYPGAEASLDETVDFVNRGAASVPAAVISGGIAVGSIDPKIVNPGTIEASRTTKLDSGITKVPLHFAHFRGAGMFDTRLYVHSFPNAPTDEIPFKIAVTDIWLWPLLAIAAGIALALGVTHLAERVRPQEENRLRVIQLRERIARLRALTSSASRISEIDDLSQRLSMLDREIDSGDFTAVATDLALLANDIAQEAKTLLDEQRDARNGLAEVTERITSLESRDDLDDAHKKTVARLRGLLNQAQQEVDNRDFAMANVTLNTIRAQMPYIESAAFAAPGMRAVATAAQPDEQIAIADPPDAWQTDREMSFSVNVAGKTYVWNFGDGEVRGGAKARHTFSVAGDVTVSVSVRDENDVEIQKLFRRVSIHPSAIDRDYSQREAKLRRINWTLALISALVATTSGIWLLYAGRVFGTPANYLEAFLWGFGIDNSVRGIASVMQKVAPRT
jgi:hypothetical protein